MSVYAVLIQVNVANLLNAIPFTNYMARDLEMNKTQHLTFKETIVKKVRLNNRNN